MVHVHEVVEDEINIRRQAIKDKPTWKRVIEAGIVALENEEAEGSLDEYED